MLKIGDIVLIQNHISATKEINSLVGSLGIIKHIDVDLNLNYPYLVVFNTENKALYEEFFNERELVRIEPNDITEELYY